MASVVNNSCPQICPSSIDMYNNDVGKESAQKFMKQTGDLKAATDLDMRNGHKGGVRVGFIYINDMYNNDVCKWVVYAYEAYEAK